MKRRKRDSVRPFVVPIALLAFCGFGTQGHAQERGNPNTAQIEEITGAKGTLFADEGVFKVTFPRTDVPIKVDGRAMEPFMGFTSWAAFKAGAAVECMVMGDLVLFEDEVSAVMDACLESGVAVTALHNHFFFDEPKVYFMHIGGEGTTGQLAGGVKKALEAVKVVRTTTPQPAKTFGLGSVPTKNTIAAQAIDDILGVKGQAKNGMYKAVIGRAVKMACGCEVTKEMGVNTWAAFAGTDDNALIDGDFAVLESELQPVLKALRKSGIHVVAIHHHMVGESPRMLFLHYWGVGKAVELARGVKSALAAQASVGTTESP